MKMSLGNKSQAFTTDFTTSVVVFLFVLVLIVYAWDQASYDILNKEQIDEMKWVGQTVLEQLIRTPGIPADWVEKPADAKLIGLTDEKPLKTTAKPGFALTYFVQNRLIDADKLYYLIYLCGNNYPSTRGRLLRLGNYDFFLELECLNRSGVKSCFAGQYFDNIMRGEFYCGNSDYLFIRNQRFVYADYPSSLISLWMFDEDYGKTAYDLMGRNDGLIWGATYIDAYLGSALRFKGKKEYVDFGSSPTLYPGSGLSIEAWVSPQKLKEAVFLEKNNTYYLKITPAGHVEGGVYNVGPGPSIVKTHSATRLTPNRWHHIVYTLNMSSNQQTIYINGVPEKTTTHIFTLPPEDEAVFTVGRGLNGSLDHVGIYGDTLTSDDVKTLYLTENNTIDKCVFGFSPYDDHANREHLLEVVPHEATVTLTKPLDIEKLGDATPTILKPTLRIRFIVWTSNIVLTPSPGSPHTLVPA